MTEQHDDEDRVLGHEFITVADRRWCVGCDLFQARKAHGAFLFPMPSKPCPRDTPYAVLHDQQEQK